MADGIAEVAQPATRRPGLVGAVIGVAAAGAAAGVALERYLVRRSRTQEADPYAREPFGQLTADKTLMVEATDGVELYCEVVEPAGATPPDLTIVFVHGFCLDMGTFHFQRRALSRLRSPRARMVFFDQPGHGKSGRRKAGEYTLDQLGDDLRRVVDATAPDGPLVLVGHSMGGMSVMSLAERQPELFASRVAGVALLSTSAGRLDEVTFGLPDVLARMRRPLMPMLTGAVRLTPDLVERGRRASSDLAWLLTRRYGFGSSSPSPALVSYVEKMNSTTSVEVITGYLRTLFEHVRYRALETLQGMEVLVLCGAKDLITPVAHSEEIARLLPSAELVIIQDAGHVVLLEQQQQVNQHLVAFLKRAARTAHALRS